MTETLSCMACGCEGFKVEKRPRFHYPQTYQKWDYSYECAKCGEKMAIEWIARLEVL